jgi:hypothetical protein
MGEWRTFWRTLGVHAVWTCCGEWGMRVGRVFGKGVGIEEGVCRITSCRWPPSAFKPSVLITPGAARDARGGGVLLGTHRDGGWACGAGGSACAAAACGTTGVAQGSSLPEPRRPPGRQALGRVPRPDHPGRPGTSATGPWPVFTGPIRRSARAGCAAWHGPGASGPSCHGRVSTV